MTEIHKEMEFRAAAGGTIATMICFHSTRSAYSRRTVRILAELEPNFSVAQFCLVDADKETLAHLLVELRVTGLPTILVFRAGSQVGCVLGEHCAKNLEKILRNLL